MKLVYALSRPPTTAWEAAPQSRDRLAPHAHPPSTFPTVAEALATCSGGSCGPGSSCRVFGPPQRTHSTVPRRPPSAIWGVGAPSEGVVLRTGPLCRWQASGRLSSGMSPAPSAARWSEWEGICHQPPRTCSQQRTGCSGATQPSLPHRKLSSVTTLGTSIIYVTRHRPGATSCDVCDYTSPLLVLLIFMFPDMFTSSFKKQNMSQKQPVGGL